MARLTIDPVPSTDWASEKPMRSALPTGPLACQKSLLEPQGRQPNSTFQEGGHAGFKHSRKFRQRKREVINGRERLMIPHLPAEATKEEAKPVEKPKECGKTAEVPQKQQRQWM